MTNWLKICSMNLETGFIFKEKQAFYGPVFLIFMILFFYFKNKAKVSFQELIFNKKAGNFPAYLI